MNSILWHLQKEFPDLDNVRVLTELPGYNGWLVHLCYSTGKCAQFQVDRAECDDYDMHKLTRDAIINGQSISTQPGTKRHTGRIVRLFGLMNFRRRHKKRIGPMLRQFTKQLRH